MTDLAGAVVLVVGASGGLGLRLAAMLEDEGALVVRTARGSDPERAQGALLADLRDRSAPATLVGAVLERHGRLDGVVVAAGLVAFGPAVELDDDVLDDLLAVNATGPIRLLREAHAALADSAAQGREPFVVTLSGVVAESPTSGMAAYSASKATLAAFVAAASREHRRSGIRLLDARPGHTDTGLASRAIAGRAPSFGSALDPDVVAERIVRAVVDGDRDLPSTAFSG
ncbi:SDR family NAD(P)-dependent oxidoreductase [Frigoribacterium salinisoli]